MTEDTRLHGGPLNDDELRALAALMRDYDLVGALKRLPGDELATVRLILGNVVPLIAEVRKLREALAPFALQVHHIDNAVDGQVRVWVSDVRKAANAYHGK